MTTVNPIWLLWWRVRYAYWIWRRCRCSCTLSFAWEAAKADESYTDDWTPQEAVDSEMSYWGD